MAGIAIAGCAIAGTGGTTEELRGGGGGILHIGRRRTKDELRAERERLGILPKPEIVRQALARPDPLQVLEDQLDREMVAYKAAYRDALMRELRLRQQQRDDEAIALVLLLH